MVVDEPVTLIKEEEEDLIEFEELDEEEGEDDEIDWEDEEEAEEEAPLAGEPAKKIPVRKPKSGGSDREAKMKKDRVESAKRYESLRLYEDAIKYYTMAGELPEAERVRGIMEGLYLNKAKEFEQAGRMDEAAHLYDILKMKEDAVRCRSQSSVPKATDLDDEEASDGAIAAFTSMNNPDLHITNPETSPYIAAGQEQVSDVPIKKPKEKKKEFTFCPYCGEEFDLPKAPKFCPYCREPLGQ